VSQDEKMNTTWLPGTSAQKENLEAVSLPGFRYQVLVVVVQVV
jgi:hypothetical protein